MSLLSEADVVAFRREHYELLSRLLAGEPDAELLGALRESIEDRAIGAAQVHRLMGEGWRLMGEYLASDSHEDVVTEFTRIFLGPFGDMLNPYESYYFTKSLYSHPLADVRGFLARQSLEPVETERKEPEDVLAFELAIMAQLIARQQAAGDADPATLIEPQREFLSQHLLIWGPACAADIEANPNGRFYKGVGQLLLGFFEVERDFFSEDGGMEVESLEQARKRYHATGYRGPIYDPEQLMAGKAPKEGKDK
jgi:TorA maturation chaperone TorD